MVFRAEAEPYRVSANRKAQGPPYRRAGDVALEELTSDSGDTAALRHRQWQALTERGKIEIDDDLIAFGWIDLNRGVARRKSISEEFQLDGGANERTTAISANVIGLAGIFEWRQCFLIANHLNLKILPEVRRSRDVIPRRARGLPGWIGNEGWVRVRQLNFHYDLHSLHHVPVLDFGLLRAVTVRMLARELRKKRVRREEGNRRDVRPSFRRAKMFDVLVEKAP